MSVYIKKINWRSPACNCNKNAKVLSLSLSPIKLCDWFRLMLRCTFIYDQVCQWLVVGQWFSPNCKYFGFFNQSKMPQYTQNIAESGFKHPWPITLKRTKLTPAPPPLWLHNAILAHILLYFSQVHLYRMYLSHMSYK